VPLRRSKVTIDEATAPFHATELRFIIGTDDNRREGQAFSCAANGRYASLSLPGRTAERWQRSRYRLSSTAAPTMRWPCRRRHAIGAWRHDPTPKRRQKYLAVIAWRDRRSVN